MIRQFVHFSLNQRLLTIALAILLIGLGIFSYFQLQIEAYPDVSDTEVLVISMYPGRAAEEVELQVTVPLERALNNLSHVISRRSKTIFGLSVIRLTFDEKVDDYFARQQVMEKLRDADLPDGVSPALGPMSTPVGEIYRYVITAPDSLSTMDLRTMQDWFIIPKILQTPGVADVVTFGGLVKQFHIIVNPLRLQELGISISQIQDIIKNNNFNTGGNVLERGPQAIVIRGIGAVKSKEDIENIVVLARKGVPIYVKDVAKVDVGFMQPSGVLGYAIKSQQIDEPKGIQGIVLMRRKENPSQVLEEFDKQIKKINLNLPKGVHLEPIIDRRELVENTLHTVSHTLIEGMVIVVLVLFFFLGNVRAALVTAITIPVSLLIAFILMKLTNIPANLLSLGAIDFGIIVDGAVIMVENIMHRLKHKTQYEKDNHTNLWVIKDATKEVEKQIFFSVAIIILAYIPLFTLQRVEGKLFSPMAYTLSFAILGSLILALSLIPVVLSFVLKENFKEWENPIAIFINKVYFKLVPTIIKFRKLIITTTGFVIIGVIFIATKMGTEFLPNLDEGAINMRTVMATGTSLKSSSSVANEIRDMLLKFPEIKSVVTQTGRNEDGTDPYGSNRIESFVGLKPYDNWRKGITKDDLLKEIKHNMNVRFPGAIFSFSQPILDNVSEAVTGSVADLAIIVKGKNLDTLRNVCSRILNEVKKVQGSVDYGIEQEGPQSQLIIKVNRENTARYGLNVSEIQSIVESAIGGKIISTAYEDEKKFDIVVRYPVENRDNINEISSLLITSPAGEKIPLSSLTDIYLADGQTLIARQDGERLVSVKTDVEDRDQGSFVKEAQERVSKSVVIPEGYTISWGGQFENLQRAGARLALVVPVTILIIFAVLFMLFKKIKYALIVLSNVLFALVGGVLALLLRGMNFNVSAGVGFISLFGVAVMSGVMLISKFNQLRFEKGMSLEESILEGCKVQLRPILMMMTVALIGLIPAAMATGIGSDVQRPLATVIVGGLASSLILTLITLPSLYMAVEKTINIPIDTDDVE